MSGWDFLFASLAVLVASAWALGEIVYRRAQLVSSARVLAERVR
jgi:hypothetical protein